MTKITRESVNPHDTEVLQILTSDILKNPENPRLIFNQSELDTLQESISLVGIQVPITVYRSRKEIGRYVILDGERRWRCAAKLNLRKMPALVRSEPNELENLLIMFNIHNVRENWTLLATAFKLKRIRDLAAEVAVDKKPPNDKEVEAITGVRAVQVKRAFELLELPQEDLDRLENELQKPKREQSVSEDFYIEAIRAAKTIERHKPDVARYFSRDQIIHSLLDKYDSKVITNIVEIRDVSRLARADVTLDVDSEVVNTSLLNLFENEKEKISTAFEKAASAAYLARTVKKKIEDLTKDLSEASKELVNDLEIIRALEELQLSISNFRQGIR